LEDVASKEELVEVAVAEEEGKRDLTYLREELGAASSICAREQ
jgi:hypothetical protein